MPCQWTKGSESLPSRDPFSTPGRNMAIPEIWWYPEGETSSFLSQAMPLETQGLVSNPNDGTRADAQPTESTHQHALGGMSGGQREPDCRSPLKAAEQHAATTIRASPDLTTPSTTPYPAPSSPPPHVLHSPERDFPIDCHASPPPSPPVQKCIHDSTQFPRVLHLPLKSSILLSSPARPSSPRYPREEHHYVEQPLPPPTPTTPMPKPSSTVTPKAPPHPGVERPAPPWAEHEDMVTGMPPPGIWTRTATEHGASWPVAPNRTCASSEFLGERTRIKANAAMAHLDYYANYQNRAVARGRLDKDEDPLQRYLQDATESRPPPRGASPASRFASGQAAAESNKDQAHICEEVISPLQSLPPARNDVVFSIPRTSPRASSRSPAARYGRGRYPARATYIDDDADDEHIGVSPWRSVSPCKNDARVRSASPLRSAPLCKNDRICRGRNHDPRSSVPPRRSLTPDIARWDTTPASPRVPRTDKTKNAAGFAQEPVTMTTCAHRPGEVTAILHRMPIPELIPEPRADKKSPSHVAPADLITQRDDWWRKASEGGVAESELSSGCQLQAMCDALGCDLSPHSPGRVKLRYPYNTNNKAGRAPDEGRMAAPRQRYVPRDGDEEPRVGRPDASCAAFTPAITEEQARRDSMASIQQRLRALLVKHVDPMLDAITQEDCQFRHALALPPPTKCKSSLASPPPPPPPRYPLQRHVSAAAPTAAKGGGAPLFGTVAHREAVCHPSPRDNCPYNGILRRGSPRATMTEQQPTARGPSPVRAIAQPPVPCVPSPRRCYLQEYTTARDEPGAPCSGAWRCGPMQRGRPKGQIAPALPCPCPATEEYAQSQLQATQADAVAGITLSPRMKRAMRMKDQQCGALPSDGRCCRCPVDADGESSCEFVRQLHHYSGRTVQIGSDNAASTGADNYPLARRPDPRWRFPGTDSQADFRVG
eukprot:GEMP01006559.1.p1 GENE.GEMP01006559.1~~GEMP01006559.1.p1  ORF type:complete len:1006 (+),score=261.93 GEMP01006559.1:196-3018(+)